MWRAFHDLGRPGTYVDVGAADPTVDSITRAFCERGWSGINVEPVPAYAAALRTQRPQDHTFECAAGEVRGSADFGVIAGTGLSSFDPRVWSGADRRGFTVEVVSVEVRPLDDLLVEAEVVPGDIQFLKIDVEGAEHLVLSGLDLALWRPWVLVIESTAPMGTDQTHEAWESLVLDAGYRFCLFDGLNRFYVSGEHPGFEPRISYPVGVFDFPFERAQAVLERERERTRFEQELTTQRGHLDTVTADAVRWRNDAARLRDELGACHSHLDRTNEAHRGVVARVQELQHEISAAYILIDAMTHTLSWRVTKPLRGVRRLLKTTDPTRESHLSVESGPQSDPTQTTDPFPGFEPSICARIGVIVQLIDPTSTLPAHGFDRALDALEQAADASSLPASTVGWLGFVAIRGAYPDDNELETASRAFRQGGGAGLVQYVRNAVAQLMKSGVTTSSPLTVVEDMALIDVSHTAMYDLHTGIQRVVRECVSRWLSDESAVIVHWNLSTHSVKRLDVDEAERFRSWQTHMHEAGSPIAARSLAELDGCTVIPWQCRFVLPELVDSTSRCSSYRALARSGILSKFSLVGYDMIPMTASETVTEGMTANFGQYLSLVKYASHLSAISRSAASEFEAFNAMLKAQGLGGPQVFTDLLPSEKPPLSRETIEQASTDLGIGTLPLVVVVGSHEPRKNHLVVLEAAEQLWLSGRRFDLVFAGGSSWGRTDFDSTISRLAAEGRPVRVLERLTEESLWTLYHRARCSVFPSLIEGYGLPVAEALSCGTPVITSNYGSMAEIAAGGGSLLVDPRDPEALAAAIDELLIDDEIHARLAAEALGRSWPTWDRYAASLWAKLALP